MAKAISLKLAADKIQNQVNIDTSLLQSDRFLIEAKWPMVEEIVNFRNLVPAENTDMYLDRSSKCPECSTGVTNDPSSEELKQLVEETRLRLAFLERVSYL